MATIRHVRKVAQAAQKLCASPELWRELSGAQEAVGLSAAAGNGASSHSAVLLQQRNHVADSPGVEGGGVELMPELDEIALSLALNSESRAFSFSICSASLLTRKDSLFSCFVRSLEALICLSISGLRRQLSVCKNKRHRGKDEPHAPLLLELEADA